MDEDKYTGGEGNAGETSFQELTRDGGDVVYDVRDKSPRSGLMPPMPRLDGLSGASDDEIQRDLIRRERWERWRKEHFGPRYGCVAIA